jgi:hypothetical protein
MSIFHLLVILLGKLQCLVGFDLQQLQAYVLFTCGSYQTQILQNCIHVIRIVMISAEGAHGLTKKKTWG